MRIILISLLSCLVLGASPRKDAPGSYHVQVVWGDGAVNSLDARIAHQPAIRITDGDGKPVAGASVQFDTPKAGPGAVFGAGTTNFTTNTNANGIATANGMMQNGVPGAFTILVRAAYQGQTIAEVALHQTNSKLKTTALAQSAQDNKTPQTYEDASMSSTVLGIALGDQFLINGTNTPGNANLLPGSRVQTQNTPVTIHIHDQCEFLLGPHSSIVVQPHSISVAMGAVRAKQFGDCKVGYGGLWVTSATPDGDGVVALSTNTMEVGSMRGPIQISNALKVVGTVQPGTVSSFTLADTPAGAASGASLGAPMAGKVAFMLGAGTGASLLGLGLAVTAITQPSPAPTSP